ncbi:NAD(P)/FAD-dependent oxidoreductase [uncultured Zhongshania sp.]|uniref:flavin-containing monooxygenase n=1 Tax=uncultured Zhongshania sp. TaxID=1642288 RepID=UPI0030DDBFA0|tara:strand:+ start:597 stop:2054 length:1458 start_codon:yes stop_codon:yes gene_type:complete
MKNLDVVILGAGMSGLCMAIKLREAGISNFEIIEKNSEVGGTWHENTYPGACCDVPAALYSFSFEPNPDWSRTYSPQLEIKRYFQHCADKYALRPHIRFNCEAVSADYQQEGHWLITLANGEQLRSRILISGIGQLNRPNIPHFAGAEQFTGQTFHSARWRHDLDFKGKRIAVIGSAASAIQLIPVLAKQAEKVYVYQRSASYIIPREDRAYSTGAKRLFRNQPWTQKLLRLFYYLRQDYFTFGAMLVGSLRGKIINVIFKKYLKASISDPELRELLRPNYPLGCKRILVSDDFYDAFENYNAELVTSAIQGMDSEGVLTNDGIQRPVDVIVYATGFKATDFLVPLIVHGENGIDLNTVWRNGAEAHRGVALAGFPNFYMLYGPNTNLGHSSIIYMVEKQVGYLMQCITKTLKEDLRSLQPTAVAQQAFNKRMQDALADTVWGGDCGSWYKNESGKIINNWPYNTTRFGREMKTVDFDEYRQERG